MKLLKLHIENFGKLSGFDYHFTDGLNLLHEENGWGKTTLAVFLKAMFYGLPATAKRSLEENERKKYTPWQGGAYGGTLDFSCRTGRFRIERYFGAKEADDSFTLYDLTTSRPSDVFDKNLGEALFGIDADGFERSVYLSQKLNIKGDTSGIRSKLVGLLDAVDDMGSYDGAAEILEERRRHYVMTGNRGAIAEMEQRRMEIQRELENATREDEAMQELERKLAETNEKIEALQKTVTETRKSIKDAGLAREAAANRSQKERLEEECRRLSLRASRLSDKFYGHTPTEKLIAEKSALYDEIRKTEAKLQAIPAEAEDKERLAALAKIFPTGIPTAEEFAALEDGNQRLLQLSAQEELLQKSRESRMDPRFATGIPTDEKVAATLDIARQASDAIDWARRIKYKNRGNAWGFALALSLIGAAGSGAGCLPILRNLQLPLLIAGAALLIVGLVLAFRAIARARAYRRAEAAERDANAELEPVKLFLSRYGMDPADPVMSLEQLQLLCKRQNANLEAYRNEGTQLGVLKEKKNALAKSMSAKLREYGGAGHLREDYRDAIDVLRREADEYTRMQKAEARRAAETAQTKERLELLRKALLPFLRTYDPGATMRAGECLQKVRDTLTDYTRTTEELAKKNEELNAFVAGHRLGDADAKTTDVEGLSKEESELQEKINVLTKQAAAQKASIAHLSQTVDRIPELNDQLAALGAEIDEARKNSQTIAHTQKFLAEAREALSTRYLSDMQKSLARNLGEFMNEIPDNVMMDSNFEVRLSEGGAARGMESFSRGWRDLVNFCVRLSLADALFEGEEEPFLLLDDPFVNLDDTRLAAARRLLDTMAEKRQIIYLVCNEARV